METICAVSGLRRVRAHGFRARDFICCVHIAACEAVSVKPTFGVHSCFTQGFGLAMKEYVQLAGLDSTKTVYYIRTIL